MPTLSVVNFNIVCATLGGFITLFGLVSYLLKEKYYLSEALISLIGGLIFSPHAANLIRPLDYAQGNAEDLETITLYFTRLVLGVQLVLAGVQLPSKYLKQEWRPLALLLGPGMCVMWIVTSLLVWALVPDINFLFALAIGACVTPTDPVLSNSIVKGKFADKNIPRDLQRIIIAESGANDGLGYPFLFLPLYLIKYVGHPELTDGHGASKAIGLWFGETWGYTILLSVVYGAVVGYIAKELLHWAEEKKYVDRESFLVFAITLALFIVGTVGMIGSDDVLACFIAGNVFTWDDWFRLETLDDSLQPTIDMLLNVSIFIWFGAVTPWYEFAHNNVIPLYRLIPLGILVLLLRRLPIVFAMHKKIRQIEEPRQALVVGFFGPIGVSAVFYLYISREFLRGINLDGVVRDDAERLSEIMLVVIWFLAICSIIVHGISIPLGKLGFYLPRTISAAVSTEPLSRRSSDDPTPIGEGALAEGSTLVSRFRKYRADTAGSSSSLPRSFYRVGRSMVSDVKRGHQKVTGAKDDSAPTNHASSKNISGPSNPRPLGKTIVGNMNTDSPLGATPTAGRSGAVTPTGSPPPLNRTIRFPDDSTSTAHSS
ncbi:Na+/H+ antiporter [Aureobasidium pullulans]|uniref:Na+/H+ antiporter n=1 Tax=Aureobasidium pullulans TaxID=5580 RepID=A0A4T0BUA6_AURPU|nr:Na+/H+ antiporter [Aureobasidium pullulans]